MGINAGHPKKVSVFRRFWGWLTGRRNRRGGMPDKETPRQETVGNPASSQPPEAYGDRLYKRLEEYKEPLRTGGSGALRVYEYCGVVFPKADIVYHYISTGEKIQVGDRVLVPVLVHGEHKQAVGIVVSVGQYLNQCLPRPLQKTKYIIKKL